MKQTGGPREHSGAEDKDARIVELEAEVEQMRQQMRSFSYSVSHDLRAPLRAIEGFGRILLEDYGKNLDEDGHRFLQHVLSNAQIMSTLIDDLLKFHRLGERTVTKMTVDMNQLAREVVDSVPKPEGVNPEFKVSNLPALHADRALLQTALEHLIGNAIKFSKRNPKPVIELGCTPRDGEQILWVRDNGIGFDMQYADKLFQIFQKLQKEPDFEGNGIGLSLVKRVADKLGGRVWTESKPNQGATFFLALPA